MLPTARVRSFLVACLLVLWGLAAPAIAGVRADFDHDGLIDSARIVSGAYPHIEVTLSGTDRFLFLPLKEHLFSLVAADVDHDGFVDLAGASQRRGLQIWKNRGGGRFKTRHHRLGSHPLDDLVLTRQRQSLHDWPFSFSDLDPATTVEKQQLQPPLAVASSFSTLTFTSTRLRLARVVLPGDVRSRPAGSRAPPVRSL